MGAGGLPGRAGRDVSAGLQLAPHGRLDLSTRDPDIGEKPIIERLKGLARRAERESRANGSQDPGYEHGNLLEHVGRRGASSTLPLDDVDAPIVARLRPLVARRVSDRRPSRKDHPLLADPRRCPESCRASRYSLACGALSVARSVISSPLAVVSPRLYRDVVAWAGPKKP